MLSGREYGIIESIEKEELSTPEETYNFEVAEYHTYYVGDNGVLVHNDGCYIGKTPDGKDYIGRSKNIQKRSEQHYRTKRLVENSVKNLTSDNLSYKEARMLEQILIERHGGIAKLGNKINGIAKTKPLYKEMKKMEAYLEQFIIG